MIQTLTILFPSFKCKEYAEIVIKSFEKFRPTHLNFKPFSVKYVIVENSDDISYKDDILALSQNITWVQNNIDMSRFPKNVAHSFANAIGVARGLNEVNTEWVFIAHSDVCVTDSSFFIELGKKANEGNVLIGTVKDNSRIKAIHVSGYLTRTDLAKKISYLPVVALNSEDKNAQIILDVGDQLDLLCRRNGYTTFCFKNTENGDDLTDEFYSSFHVDRCMNSSGHVMFMHLGRGTDKAMERYTKEGHILKQDWIKFCQQFT